MSINSEINRIETEVGEQTNIINQIKTALEGNLAKKVSEESNLANTETTE